MTFEQRMAGNAKNSTHASIPALPASRFRLPIMLSRSPLLFALLALLVLPVSARAADPLLSGYAGPGSGEQVVLGGGTVGGGGGSSGSGGAGATADQSLRATTPASSAPSASGTGSTLSRKPQPKSPSSSASEQKMSGTSISTKTSTAAARQPAGAPRVVAYPTRDGDVGALPVSLSEALLGVLGLGLLVLAALGLRRFAGDRRPQGPTPQVPVR
jgi:hypothetical protein